jgi:2-polyprenyl-6-methoxyphenol hydroxylase-like FAD-dependent oxidoreductase
MAKIAEHAVVIGAGMGGLAAAAAASPYFERVTVLERDTLPAEPQWRIGTPQCRHAHALLLGGLAALGELMPGFETRLADAGAEPFRLSIDFQNETPGYNPFPRRDLGLPPAYTMTRPLLELTTRRCAEALGNIEVKDRHAVRELAWDGGKVTGVRMGASGGDELVAADLVIDSSGRGAPTFALLKSLGHPLPDEDVITINASYASVIVKKPEGWVDDWRIAISLPEPPTTRAGTFCFTVEDGCWIATVIELHGGEPPEDWESFLAAAKNLRTPTTYNAVSQGTPVGEVMRFKRPTSTRRHFERLADFPRGLVTFGDAVCQFNPVYGQGMTISALQALALRETLSAQAVEADPLGGLAEAFFARTPAVTEGAWGAARGYDFQFPETEGVKPPDHEMIMAFTKGLIELAARDADVHRLFTEVSHGLRSGAAYQEPAFAARVMGVLAEMQAQA